MPTDAPGSKTNMEAHLDGDGAISQGSGDAVGRQGVLVKGSVGGDVVTGTKITIYQGTQVEIPSVEAIVAHRAALRERLAQDAQKRWGGMGIYIREEGASLPIEASPYQEGALGPRSDLLTTLRAANRLLVLGEPGSGKTVALERLAWELCEPEGQAAPLAIPVMVRLFHYAGTLLADWMQATLRQTGHLRLDDERTADAFLSQGDARCYFLLDGLNEVAPPYRNRLVDELIRWTAAHPKHPVILTSRVQDELWRRLRQEVSEVVVTQDIGNDQIRAYLEVCLPGRGAALFERLGERLRALARRPLLLWLIKEAGAAGESVPGNRGELYARFVSRMLRRDTEHRIDAEIPEQYKRRALTTLTYALGLEHRLSCTRGEALSILAELWDEDQARSVLGACFRHGLLAGEDDVWFAPHQTVQEHFMALALQERWQAEQTWPPVRRWWQGRQAQQGRGRSVVRLAADDWWTETFVQGAGLVEDADGFAHHVSALNPWLAWWCVEEGRPVSQETREKIEAGSMRLLRSDNPDQRLRAVLTLAQIGGERALSPLFWAAGDDVLEVANAAVQALAAFGQMTEVLAHDALECGDARREMAGFRCLVTRPSTRLTIGTRARLDNSAMVYVPPGPFLMGSDKTFDEMAGDSEVPQHTVTLPAYWIGKAPVTVAQFRAFVQASGYSWKDAKQLQGRDDHPVLQVTWYDAMAYCEWLSERTGLPVGLPSEAEWEKAARGTEGRRYPWGHDWDSTKCNTNEAGIKTTTPVGRYSPEGDSPYGCVDMAGNVWEWTSSCWASYPYRVDNGREDLKADNNGYRVLRGGGQFYPRNYARCACRHRPYLDGVFGASGFRVVVSVRQDKLA